MHFPLDGFYRRYFFFGQVKFRLRLCLGNNGPGYFLTHFPEAFPGLAVVFYITDIHFFDPGLHQVHVYKNADIYAIIIKKVNPLEKIFPTRDHSAQGL